MPHHAISVSRRCECPLCIVEGGDNATPIFQSNKDLILTEFDEHMHQVFGSRTRVPRRRTVKSNQMDDFEYLQRSNLQTTEEDW